MRSTADARSSTGTYLLGLDSTHVGSLEAGRPAERDSGRDALQGLEAYFCGAATWSRARRRTLWPT
jgi:hypothetical protein